MLLEQLSNLVVYVTILLGLVRVAVWWRNQANSVPPRVTPEPPRWHPQGFEFDES